MVAIGPLTNIAAAIESDPDFAAALDRLVVMGGTVEVPGNITPAAEFNIWMDPEAARLVFDSGAAIEPDLLSYRDALVEVETSVGPAQGMTVTHLNDAMRRLLTGREHNARVAVGADVSRFVQRFDERVTGPLDGS